MYRTPAKPPQDEEKYNEWVEEQFGIIWNSNEASVARRLFKHLLVEAQREALKEALAEMRKVDEGSTTESKLMYANMSVAVMKVLSRK